MDGSVNPSEVATLSLLGGGVGGYGYNNRHGQFADHASNAVRIESHAAQNAAGVENLLDQNQFAITNGNITEGHNRITDNINVNATRSHDNTINAEFRTNDRIRDIEREISANARDAAKCCCEAKLLAVQNHATLLAGQATIIANQECATKVADAVANAMQNSKLDALLAERGGHHGRG